MHILCVSVQFRNKTSEHRMENTITAMFQELLLAKVKDQNDVDHFSFL